ncbi:ExbD/TolR family protein [Cognatazoarcus halotolerans]|uniref:ExbD/TolR family protein n=1 Tax=Cognatazoarcus halotolerans TaxID=2686016 RepID=UPI001358A743|nr:biopolymer transporter ExbD [Cognatazoarcus halotolerans]MBX3680483.1 biopolymer transporter ExbD [Rhodocyclaceae bacterium]MCB1900114.1 biopolymer transporter ExbD [Rhodocyclaceae bacterium]MCP5311297.1 biopolymer transporter ExbD [Zoogloeaceae bacterium]
MRFQSNRRQEEPEINLIPLIDVLLVIIIFLMLTTTYSRFAGLEINLPSSTADATESEPNEVNVAVTANGDVLIDKRPVGARDIASIAAALGRAAATTGKSPVVIISADAKATHQSVIDVMQAAQQAGLEQISFATQTAKR